MTKRAKMLSFDANLERSRKPKSVPPDIHKCPPLPDLSIRIMLGVLADEGLDRHPALEAAGMPQGLGDLPSEVSAEQEFAFQRAFVETTGYRPDLWLKTGMRYHLPSYGGYGMALLTAPDLDTLVGTSSVNGDLDYSLVQMTPIRHDGVLAGEALDFQRMPDSLVEFTTYRDIGAILTALHDVWNGPFPLKRIELALPRPKRSFTIMEHDVHFGAESTAVWWDRSYSTRRLYYGDPVLHSAFLQDCRQRVLMSNSRDEFIDCLTDLLLRQDGSQITLSHLAAQTGHSERTLQRRLRERGVRFRGLLEEARRRVAIDLLTATHTSIAEIAWRLGYSEATSFNHAFRRWTGVSPNAVRRGRGAAVSGR